MRRLLLLFLPALAQLPLGAQERVIPAAELARPPAAARIDALVAAAAQEGWGTWVAPLRSAAFAAYERDAVAAEPWLNLYRWARLFATPKARAIEGWVRAVDESGGAHANMETRQALPPGSLAAEVPAELQRWLLAQPGFSREFFATLSPLDHPVRTLALLSRLHAAGPALFADYASLALAIAVVHDVPPPPDWPHGQVSGTLLPRTLPAPEEAFAHWTQLDRAGMTAHRLRRLGAGELKFVVDASAPLADLAWARRHVTFPLAELSRAYDQVRYRQDRIERQQFAWPGRDYRLATVLAEGGICVDQAYFAANVGKARGVPTLLFRGAGLDGRHAWFGYLAADKWVLDAGRYAEQRFVTGYAHDPQTWRNLSDHELLFLAERFRTTPLFHLSQLHAAFADEYLRAGDAAAALRAAREAVNREPRNLDGWQVLAAAHAAAGSPAPVREAALREAMTALQRHPDLERGFARELVASLRRRGEEHQARTEEQRLLRKYGAGRTDLGVEQAAETLRRSLATEDLAGRIRTYRRLLEAQGRGAGMDFFDKVVAPFVAHLRQEGQVPAAREALQRARQTLRVEAGSQLEAEFDRAAAMLRPAR